jgi:tRNA threonylcarbamoyladenosine dehydratase
MKQHPDAFCRTDILLTPAESACLHNQHILIAGLGGVGGYVAESLCRAGILRFTLLDHDCVSPSNLNRQLVALHSTLGQPKVEVMAARMRDIHPDVTVHSRCEFLQASAAQTLIHEGDFSFVVDCIDSIACKAALVAACHHFAIPVVSSLGAGNRLDVTQVRLSRLNQVEGCALGRELRASLRKMDAPVNYPVVYSRERPRPALPHQAIEGAVSGRARAVNGTISYLPALFGVFISGVVIQQLLNQQET